MKTARRVRDIEPFQVMEVVARARELESQGRSVVHMEIGQPDFDTPAPIVEAGRRALASGRTRYTESKGIPQLREAIAARYRERYRLDLDPERIVLTPGASGALQLATATLLDPGDRVLMADPAYPCNRHFVRLADAEPVAVPVGQNSAYQLSAALVEEHRDATTRALMLASPSNPTGTTLPARELAAIMALAERHGLAVIMDEIYHGLEYDDGPAGAEGLRSALNYSDRALVINSFSKYFGMTGWRLGWLVAPADGVREIEVLAQNLFISAPTVAQYAALEAFTPACLEICEQRRDAFRERRDFLLPALRELGFEVPLQPQGAFYIYADCSRVTELDSYRFAFSLLEHAGVAVTPGVDFGSHRSEHHVRFAYTNSIDNLAEGVERLRRFLLA